MIPTPFCCKIVNSYNGLYGEADDGQPAFRSREDIFAAKWGWYQSIYAIARGDVTKFDQVTKESIHKCLTWLTFEKEKIELENRRIKDAQNRKR